MRIGALAIVSVSILLLLGFVFTGAMCGRHNFPSVQALIRLSMRGRRTRRRPCEPCWGVTDSRPISRRAVIRCGGSPVFLRNRRRRPTDALCPPSLRPSSTPNTYLHPGVGCSRRTIQLIPNRSLTCSPADAAEQLSDYAVARRTLPRWNNRCLPKIAQRNYQQPSRKPKFAASFRLRH